MRATGGVYFLSHESPMMWDTPSAARDALIELGQSIPKPKGVIFVTPHWLTSSPMISISANPSTIYDFGGFSDHYYQVKYPAPGDVSLANKAIESLAQAGVKMQGAERGFDHAVWIVSSLLWPKADVKIVSMSIPSRFTPEQLYETGKGLESLVQEGYVVIASGTWTHNLGEFFSGKDLKMNDAPADYVKDFSSWMLEKIHHLDLESLFDYRKRAPFAYQAHPSTDHISGLFVALGAAHKLTPKVIHSSTCYGFLSMVHLEWA